MEKSYDKPRQHIKKQRHHVANQGSYSSHYGFSNSQVRMGELNHKEGWAPKNWCFRTVMLEKTLETPLHCNEIKPVHPKGNQPWICIGRTDTEAETPILRPLSHQGSPILWLPDTKSRPTGKGPDAGKDWRPKEKGATEDEMAGWHHQLLEPPQSHVHCVGDAIQPSHPLSSPSTTFNLSQHQCLFKWVSSSHQVAKV